MRLMIALIAALALLLAACGGDADEVVAGAGGDETEEPADGDAETPESNDAMDEDAMEDDAMDEDEMEEHDDSGTDPSMTDGDFTKTTSSPDLISAQKAPIIDVVTIDEQTLGVRYQAGAEPCALANVTITETDSSVTVLLETGLHPNAAAMSCIAQVFDYEIEAPLEQPLGDRSIVIDGA